MKHLLVPLLAIASLHVLHADDPSDIWSWYKIYSKPDQLIDNQFIGGSLLSMEIYPLDCVCRKKKFDLALRITKTGNKARSFIVTWEERGASVYRKRKIHIDKQGKVLVGLEWYPDGSESGIAMESSLITHGELKEFQDLASALAKAIPKIRKEQLQSEGLSHNAPIFVVERYSKKDGYHAALAYQRAYPAIAKKIDALIRRLNEIAEEDRMPTDYDNLWWDGEKKSR